MFQSHLRLIADGTAHCVHQYAAFLTNRLTNALLSAINSAAYDKARSVL